MTVFFPERIGLNFFPGPIVSSPLNTEQCREFHSIQKISTHQASQQVLKINVTEAWPAFSWPHFIEEETQPREGTGLGQGTRSSWDLSLKL